MYMFFLAKSDDLILPYRNELACNAAKWMPYPKQPAIYNQTQKYIVGANIKA